MTRSILRVYSRLACGFWARTDARDVKLGAIAAWKLFGCPEWRRVPGPGANEDRKKEKRARDGLQNRCALDSFDPRTGQVNQGLSIRRPGRSWLIPPRPTFRRIVGSIRIFVFAASLVFALARSACFCAVLFNGSGVPREAPGETLGKRRVRAAPLQRQNSRGTRTTMPPRMSPAWLRWDIEAGLRLWQLMQAASAGISG